MTIRIFLCLLLSLSTAVFAANKDDTAKILVVKKLYSSHNEPALSKEFTRLLKMNEARWESGNFCLSEDFMLTGFAPDTDENLARRTLKLSMANGKVKASSKASDAAYFSVIQENGHWVIDDMIQYGESKKTFLKKCLGRKK
ncbi:MAG: hypothetical protein Q4D82_01590 [Neisseria sp.]|nr:hypothetical protein [Neisseria sp.]